MFVHLLRLLGVTPNHGKSGKREAAWALIAIALGLTIAGMWLGHEMVAAMTAILVIVWPSAILAVAGAYKLEHDKGIWKREAAAPDGWPADIVPPESDDHGDRAG